LAGETERASILQPPAAKHQLRFSRAEETVIRPAREFVTVGGIPRREFLAWSGGLLSTALLAACDARGPKAADKLLKYAERKNRAVERALYRHTAIDVVQPGAHDALNKLPSYFISPTVPVWDESVRGKWALEVSGLVARPVKLTLDDLQKLPRVSNRVNHYCVEGWTAVETWTGCPFGELAKLVGVLPDAHYVDFQSFDDGYHESWDLESAMHKQTVVAYALDGKMLEPAHGAPARVYSPVKLGYKNTKYLTKIVFMPKMNGGYWSDMGYEWYGGV
ncbi:MAG TPA: molybdopterin-dependent oxidoreductase, partial [Gemmatimonadaceae bacterium]|nr:molybdopterin-dependent oxidoreductase [Gemmatimonadaceae bacterium]